MGRQDSNLRITDVGDEQCIGSRRLTGFLKGAELCDDEADGIAQPSAVKPNRWKANNDS